MQQEMLLAGNTQGKPLGAGLTGSSPCRSKILYPQLARLAVPWIRNCSGQLLAQPASCALQDTVRCCALVLYLS